MNPENIRAEWRQAALNIIQIEETADWWLEKFAARDAEAVRHDPLNRECTRYNCDFSDYKKHQLSCPCSCSSKHDDQQRELYQATKTCLSLSCPERKGGDCNS